VVAPSTANGQALKLTLFRKPHFKRDISILGDIQNSEGMNLKNVLKFTVERINKVSVGGCHSCF
jgi:hypothetical protein